MTFTFTVSPDFPPDDIAGWYVLNTFLQRQTGEHIHLELFDRFDQQRAVIESGGIDLIYANPFDAARLVRDHGFVAVAKPIGVRDEAMIVASTTSSIERIEDLQAGCRVAVTDDPDVRMIGMIMLEPADLDATTIETVERPTYVLVAKAVLMDDADVGVFLVDAYEGLSGVTRSGLRPLVSSEIGVINHMLMVGPTMAAAVPNLSTIVLGMDDDPAQRSIVESLGFAGWSAVEHEETEFMIDLMDTLLAD